MQKIKRPRTTNIEAWGISFERHGRGKLVANLRGKSPSGARVEINVKFSYQQWPCAAREFNRAWQIEKEIRIKELNWIDKFAVDGT